MFPITSVSIELNTLEKFVPRRSVETSGSSVTSRMPFIGPSTLLPHTENPVNRYLFYLLPGITEQAASLVNFATAHTDLRNASLAIVHSDHVLGNAAAVAAEAQAKKIGRELARRQVYTSNSFDAARIVADLKARNAGAVFFFGSASSRG